MTIAAARQPRIARRRVWPYAAASIVLLVILSLIAWNNGVRDRLLPKNFGVVEPGVLYRSGQISKHLIRGVLADNHIEVIVALSGDNSHAADVAAESAAAHDLHIDREVFPLGGDGTGSLDHYTGAVAAVDHAVKSRQPVLVHCIAGAQRTGGVIALYEMFVEHRPQADVDAQLRQYGHDSHDNPKMIPFLNEHMPEIADRLVQRGVIDRVPTPLPRLGE